MALLHFLLVSVLICVVLGTDAAVFTVQNKCKETIWPGIVTGEGRPQLNSGGLTLNPGQFVHINAPTGWSGRFWARTGCTFDPSGKGKCITGDCGGVLNCAGAAGVPPVSLAEFTLNSPMDFYDVSLVDGYNLPISVIPFRGTGDKCKAVKCVSDLNQKCPIELQQVENGKVVACRSACLAFNKPEFCCTGYFGSPATCKPSEFSKIFKESCPMAYSYAYDDQTITLVLYVSIDLYYDCTHRCKNAVWPGILAGSGKPLLNNGGIALKPGERIDINAPPGWSGRLWGRTGCQFDPSGKGKCITGDCGGVLNCEGAGGEPPVSLAEFTLDSPMDFYDVSLVDGYNLPMTIIPSGGTGDKCKEVTCVSDLN
ncbi:hypothetical protein Patl1_17243 [Pistacia atlantica]|uniref:Uncharacterized protein n=1 Tax=Pistacia atlantica TaxID=434234 RepID=A0ACC1BAN0_9ROSI|nr:hypothetical protein Patl1_17243 [Pistacia atlantica]